MSRWLTPLFYCPFVCVTTGVPSSSGAVQKMVSFKRPAGRRPKEDAQHDGDENVFLDEQHYIEALGTENAEGTV